MNVSYSNTDCSTLYSEIDTEIRSWVNGCPAKGFYAVKEETSPLYIWSTRETPARKYTDDQIFELTQNGTACDVKARSRSQSHSYYDYNVNYCNLWNVLNGIGGMENLSIKDCRFHPDSPLETCVV